MSSDEVREAMIKMLVDNGFDRDEVESMMPKTAPSSPQDGKPEPVPDYCEAHGLPTPVRVVQLVSGDRWGSVVRTVFLVVWGSAALVSAVHGEWRLAITQAIVMGCIACWMSEAVRRRKAEEVVRLLRDALGLRASGHYEVVRKDAEGNS